MRRDSDHPFRYVVDGVLHELRTMVAILDTQLSFVKPPLQVVPGMLFLGGAILYTQKPGFDGVSHFFRHYSWVGLARGGPSTSGDSALRDMASLLAGMSLPR